MSTPAEMLPQPLLELFRQHFSAAPTAVQIVSPHASERSLFRLWAAEQSVIGVSSKHVKENATFVYLSELFLSLGILVPKIIAFDFSQTAYLQTDLGTTTLYDVFMADGCADGVLSPALNSLYEQVLSALPRIQFEAGASVDYSRCLEPQRHDKTAILADLYAFQREFLGRITFAADATRLSAELLQLAQWLAAAPQELSDAKRPVFMYRDFQSRNVMINAGKPYFIDFQGGRRGPIPYDVVSLLYQSSVSLSAPDRQRLREFYLSKASQYPGFSVEAFNQYFESFILLRMLQVLGTYGRQGLGLGKTYFQQSIPKALQNTIQVLPKLPFALPELTKLFEELCTRSSWAVVQKS
jgi:aminoglycoside/choline kinase family phosphotransferase